MSIPRSRSPRSSSVQPAGVPSGHSSASPWQRPEYRSSRPTSGPTISSRRPPRMWATPTRVNPIPDLSRYLDVFRMRGVEGAHDIGPAEVDVEGEVVPGPGGHAH